ncbi:MAG: signal peptidase II, partial [Acetanaerobacterium sp.]
MIIYVALFSAALLVGADQLFKYLVLEHLTQVATLPLIDGVLHLTYVENRGAAFGTLQGQRWILIGVTGLVLVGAVVFLLSGRIKEHMLIWGCSLIIAGGFGNLVDRIFRGFVVDYLDFR